jgi:hypothetical protein
VNSGDVSIGFIVILWFCRQPLHTPSLKPLNQASSQHDVELPIQFAGCYRAGKTFPMRS